MSRFKTKSGGTPEVHTARSKLDGVLQNLRDKKEDSPRNESFILEDDDDDDLDVLSFKSGRSRDRLNITGSGRKRKRPRDDSPVSLHFPQTTQFHHTYVMKLFDRSVDLAQFEEDTPLYPVCRAWMKNQPMNRNLAVQPSTPSPKDENFSISDDDDTRDIFSMPGPIVRHTDIRLPSPVPESDTEPLDVHADPEFAPKPEQLLLNHLYRWKQTREKWKDYRRRKDILYSPSMNLLKDIFDRANST